MGITDMDAKMLCTNFAHQGGYGAARRVLVKSRTPILLGIGYMHKNYVSSYTSSGFSSNIKVPQSALNNLFKSK